MLNEKYIGLIDDYLDGALHQEDKMHFEKKLQEDSELRELLGIQKMIRESIKLHGQREMVAKIHQKHKKAHSIKPTKEVTIKNWWISIAASLTFLIVTSSFWINTQVETFFDKNYMRYELPTMRSAENTQDNLHELYKNKDFEKVLASLGESYENREVLFLASLAAIELRKFDKSAQYLKKLDLINKQKSIKEQLFADEVDYYLFWSLLNLGHINESEYYFKKMMDNKSHSFHKSFSKIDQLRFSIFKIKHKN
ncbi:anti-sigma factor [Mongoliitalea daihaiensis]|uniref:hypothetical protein n=1 Tax=Mongoliitalea daihaiensis TaxID=2782006 RepID=UPI001F30C261|nr:hypothetical protein [Mongoliitalea daihaiensis]UJP64363.1 hypothetical protein IPZ59_16350 [Mongoliitalea daihaiensis]